VDPEGDAFTVGFTGCDANNVQAELCIDAACTQTTALDCSVTYATGNTPQILSVALPIAGHIMVPNLTGSSLAIDTLHFLFKDSVSLLTPADAPVIVDARRVNVAPTITIQGQDVDMYTQQVGTTDSLTPIIQIVDPDFLGQSFYTMSVDVTLVNSEPGADAGSPPANVVFNTTLLSQFGAAYTTCQQGLVVAPAHLALTCGIDSINEFLFNISLNGPNLMIPAQSVVNIQVSDNGNSGQCDVPSVNVNPCPLTDQATLTVTWAPVP
jgi:hypothetical protein